MKVTCVTCKHIGVDYLPKYDGGVMYHGGDIHCLAHKNGTNYITGDDSYGFCVEYNYNGECEKWQARTEPLEKYRTPRPKP